MLNKNNFLYLFLYVVLFSFYIITPLTLSQINYKGKKRTLNDKVKLDVKFVENYSFIIYSKIIIKTPIVLLIRLLKNKTSIIK